MYENKLKALDMKISAVQNYYVTIYLFKYFVQRTHFSPSKNKDGGPVEDASTQNGDNKRQSQERMVAGGGSQKTPQVQK